MLQLCIKVNSPSLLVFKIFAENPLGQDSEICISEKGKNGTYNSSSGYGHSNTSKSGRNVLESLLF